MDKKIIAVMITLVVVAVLVVAFGLSAAGGLGGRAGGFTTLFDKLENPSGATFDQELALPSSWHPGDVVSAADSIVDMFSSKVTYGSTTVYLTTLYFVYKGEKWNDPTRGTSFTVPVNTTSGHMHIEHGRFYVTVSSATNLAEKYDIGDVIELECELVVNDDQVLSFDVWHVANTL